MSLTPIFFSPVSNLVTEGVYSGKICNDSGCPFEWTFLALLDKGPVEAAVSYWKMARPERFELPTAWFVVLPPNHAYLMI